MHTSNSPLLAVAAPSPRFRHPHRARPGAETGADIPKNSYYKDPLTKAERNAHRRGGERLSQRRLTVRARPRTRASSPTPRTRPTAPTPRAPDADQAGASEKKAESEADIILDQSKKNDKVTKQDMASCLKDWDPQTQMSKAEWTESCRTTLEYFPDGQ